MLGERGLLGVRAAYIKAGIEQNLCKAGHADASDADEMYMDGVIEIYLIHGFMFLPEIDSSFIIYTS